MEQKEIEVKARLDFKEFIKLRFYLTYGKAIGIVIFTMCFLLILSVKFMFFFYLKTSPPLYLNVFLAIILASPLLIYYMSAKQFKVSRTYRESLTYTFKDESILIKGETFSSDITWDRIHKVVELKNWILLYFSAVQHLMVPKKALSEKNLSDLKELFLSKPDLMKKLKK